MRIAPPASLAVRSALATLPFVLCAGIAQAAPLTANQLSQLPARRVLPAPRPIGFGQQLTVPLYAQQTNVWCWDASSLMVIKYFRPYSTLQECDVAKQGTSGVTTCCGMPFPTPCVHGGWEMLTPNGFSSTQTGTLSFAAIKAQVSNQHKPVLYAIAWPGGGGHMLVATGWFTFAGMNFVRVNDPWPPPSGSSPGAATESPTYEAWLGGPGYDHNPWAQWSDITDTRRIIIRTPIAYQLKPVTPIPGPDPMRLATVRPEETERASRTLTQLRTAPPELLAQLGFRTAAEARGATLGTPLREFIVPLNALRRYGAGSAPERLLTGGTTLFYPVIANGQIRSSVRVSASPNAEPKLISIGDTGTASRLQQIESLGPQLRKAGGESIPAVRVPALGLYFIARTGSNGMELASTFDVPSLGLRRGNYESASAVFARLAPAAQKLDPNKVM